MDNKSTLKENNIEGLLSTLIDKINKIEKEIEGQRKMMIHNKDILSLEEASWFVGISPNTMYKNKVDITYYQPKRKHIYFKKEDLETYLLRNKFEPKEDSKSKAYKYTSTHRR